MRDRAGALEPEPATASPGSRPVVRWERLRLQGFGTHADLTVRFPSGLGVWTAPNEAGKTTALLGLVATIWGLPHVQDAHGFTWTRFRSWSGGPHRGEVGLRAGEARFTVQREFATHRVRVIAHEDAGDRVLVDATHNPNARKEVTPYLPWLESTLALTEAPLVLATFVVAQGDLGGHPHALGGDVQGLIAGAGGGWTVARDRLEGALRARTRRVRGLAPSLSRDGTVDRALEEAEARVAELESALAAGRTVADAFERAQHAVRAAERARAEARERRGAWAAAVEAQRAWTAAREDLLRARRRHAERDRAAAAARARLLEVERARAAADACHPELRGAVADLEERLEAWAAAEARHEERRRRLDRARAARDEAVRGAHDAVASALAVERGVPVPTRDWSTWGTPAAPAVDAVAAAAVRWREAVAEAWAARDLRDQIDAELAPLAALGEVDADLVPHLRGYAATREAWAERVAQARDAAARSRDRVAEHEERFGPVQALPSDTAAALRAFGMAWERPDGTGGLRWLGAVAAVALVGWGGERLAATWGWSVPSGVSWAIGALVAILWVLALPRRPALRRAQRRLETLARQGALDPTADDDERRLELARRQEAYDALGDDVARAAAEHDEIERARGEIEAGAAAFHAVWGPTRDALLAAGAPVDVDLGRAHERFEGLQAERRVADARLHASERALGVAVTVSSAPSPAVDASAPAADVGPDGARLAAWAQFQGAVGSDGTVGEVTAWLDRLSAATWSRWREEAAAADRSAVRRAEAVARRVRAEEGAARVAAERERAVKAEEDAVRESAARLDAARAHAGAGTGDAGARFPVDEDPQAVRAAWRSRREAAARSTAAEAAAAAHLQALGIVADTLEEGVAIAEDGVRDAGLEAMVALNAWRDLVAAHPSLPAVDPDTFRDPAERFVRGADVRPAKVFDVERRFDAARHELTQAVADQERAEAAFLDAREALVRLQGADPIDVAAAEVELMALSSDVTRLRGERDALALALRTLGEAVEDFRGAHAERLERAAGASFSRFSGRAGRRVALDEGFAAHVIEPGGDVAVPAQLSQGARDQLALALRLAVADLLADDVRLPLVLDDPFLNWDEERLARAAETLTQLAGDRQVIVLSHRPALTDWGTPIDVEAS